MYGAHFHTEHSTTRGPLPYQFVLGCGSRDKRILGDGEIEDRQVRYLRLHWGRVGVTDAWGWYGWGAYLAAGGDRVASFVALSVLLRVASVMFGFFKVCQIILLFLLLLWVGSATSSILYHVDGSVVDPKQAKGHDVTTWHNTSNLSLAALWTLVRVSNYGSRRTGSSHE